MKLTLFLDFDGTLNDTSNRYYETYKRSFIHTQHKCCIAAETNQLQMMSKNEFWNLKRNRTPDVDIAAKSGFSNQQTQIFLDSVYGLVNHSDLVSMDKPLPQAEWALAQLSASQCSLFLITLRMQEEAMHMLEQYGWLRFFNAVYGMRSNKTQSETFPEIKSRLLQEAFKHHFVAKPDPNTTWMIGDTEADVLAGKANGLGTIALTCGIRSYSNLAKLQPDAIQSNLLTAVNYLKHLNSVSFSA